MTTTSPIGSTQTIERHLIASTHRIRFTVQFNPTGPVVAAALENEKKAFINIAMEELPLLSGSLPKTERVLGVLRERAIAEFRGKVIFLPNSPVEPFKEIESELSQKPFSEELESTLERYRQAGILEQLRPLIAAYEKAQTSNDPKNITTALLNLGDGYKAVHNYNGALLCYHQPLLKDDITDKGRVYCKLGEFYKSLKGYKKGIEYYEKALKVAEQTCDLTMQVKVLDCLGDCYRNLDEYKSAIVFYEKALKVAEQARDLTMQGRICGNLGVDYDSLGEFKKAIEYHEKSLKISKRIGDMTMRGLACSNLGSAYRSIGDYKKAIEFHEKSLKIAKETSDFVLQGRAYSRLGNVYDNLGDHKKAMEYHEKCFKGHLKPIGMPFPEMNYDSVGDFDQALQYELIERGLKVAEGTKDLETKARTYGTIGEACNKIGDYKRAVEFLQKCLMLAKQMGDIALQENCYESLGNGHKALGEYKKAIEYYEKNLRVAERADSLVGQRTLYDNLGAAYDSLGDYNKAIEYHEKALEIAHRTGNLGDQGTIYNNLGNASLRLGEYEKAIDYFEKALTIAQQTGVIADQGRACGNLGNVHNQLGDYEEARGYHEKALTIAQQAGIITMQGAAYGNLGIVHNQIGNDEKALECYENSLLIAEETGDITMQGRALCGLGKVYQKLQNYPRAAGYYKSAIELYAYQEQINTQGNFQQGIAYFETLFQPFRLLEKTHLLLSPPSTVEALELTDWGRARALTSFLAGKNLASKVQSLPFSALQQMAARHRTTIVVYSCNPFKSAEAWCWVIDPLPKKPLGFRKLDLTPIEEQLSRRDERPKHLKDVRSTVASQATREDLSFDDINDWVNRSLALHEESFRGRVPIPYERTLTTIWYKSLIGPISDLLPNQEGARVTIVPDGALGDLPFILFQDDQGKTVLEKYTLTTIPSIQSLYYLDQIESRKAPLRDRSNACVVANPTLPPDKMLAGAEAEGKLIASQFSKSTLLLNDKATAAAVKAALPHAAFIHLACHGETIDENNKPIRKEKNSVFQGRFVLSNFEGLFGDDLLDTPLNAELAVLSACYSGKGNICKEGVVGPAHALLAAGVSTVIGSRWELPDDTTKRVMERFYELILKDSPESKKAKTEGCPFGKTEALRQTLLELKKNHPNYSQAWGAFFCLGLPGGETYGELPIIKSQETIFNEQYGEEVKMLEGKVRALSQNDPFTPTSLGNLIATINTIASLYTSSGIYQTALNWHQKSTKLIEEVLGENHQILGLLLSQQATLFQQLGQHEQAIALYERVAEIRMKELGEEHLYVAKIWDQLSIAHLQNKNEPSARYYREKALAIRVKKLGANHPLAQTVPGEKRRPRNVPHDLTHDKVESKQSESNTFEIANDKMAPGDGKPKSINPPPPGVVKSRPKKSGGLPSKFYDKKEPLSKDPIDLP